MTTDFKKLGLTQDEFIGITVEVSELPDKFYKHEGKKVRITETIVPEGLYDRHFTTSSTMIMVFGSSGVRFSGLRLSLNSPDYCEGYEIDVSSVYKIESEDSRHYRIFECLDYSGERMLQRISEIEFIWE